MPKSALISQLPQPSGASLQNPPGRVLFNHGLES